MLDFLLLQETLSFLLVLTLVESVAVSTLLEVLNTVAAVPAAVFVSNEADSDQIDADLDQNRGHLQRVRSSSSSIGGVHGDGTREKQDSGGQGMGLIFLKLDVGIVWQHHL